MPAYGYRPKKSAQKQRINKRKRQRQKKISKRKKTITIRTTVIIISFGCVITARLRINGAKYTIQGVLINEIEKSQANTQQIIEKVQTILYNESYIKIRLRKGENIKNEILNSFPIIKSVEFVDYQDNRITTTLHYHQPKIVLKNEKNTDKHGVHQNNVYKMDDSYNMLNTSTNFEITIPAIYYKEQNYEGIFHQISEQKLYSDIQKISEKMQINKIEYHIGGSKLIITNDNHRCFFNLEKNIDEQLKKRENIKTFYKNFENIEEVDVASTTKPIIRLRTTM